MLPVRRYGAAAIAVGCLLAATIGHATPPTSQVIDRLAATLAKPEPGTKHGNPVAGTCAMLIAAPQGSCLPPRTTP